MPRMMIDVSIRNLKTKVLGQTISMPIGISPTAMQKMAHPDGEWWVSSTPFSLSFTSSIKFTYSEKATKFCEISTVDLTYAVTL